MLTVRAVADLHGWLPDIDPCDVLVVAGDTVPPDAEGEASGRRWARGPLRRWVETVPAREIVAVAGNHDIVFQNQPDVAYELPWTYLRDEGAYVQGLRVYGTPWTPRMGGWAFEADDPSELAAVYSRVPTGLDLLVSHGPPRGAGDRELGPLVFGHRGFEEPTRRGSVALAHTVALARPKFVVCGHVHSDRGVFSAGPTTVVNAAVAAAGSNEPRHPPLSFELQPRP